MQIAHYSLHPRLEYLVGLLAWCIQLCVRLHLGGQEYYLMIYYI